MKKILLILALIGFCVMTPFIAVSLIRDPFIIWMQPTRVIPAQDVIVLSHEDRGKAGVLYRLQYQSSVITARGRLEKDSILVPMIEMFYGRSSYSVVNNILLSSIFRSIGLVVCLLIMAVIAFELKIL